MRSMILSFNFTSSDHMASFPYSLQFDLSKEYEASLLSMETYHTLFNITEKNKKFSYDLESGYKTKTIPPRAYEIYQISSEIVYLMKKQRDDLRNLTISIQKHSSKSSI